MLYFYVAFTLLARQSAILKKFLIKIVTCMELEFNEGVEGGPHVMIDDGDGLKLVMEVMMRRQISCFQESVSVLFFRKVPLIIFIGPQHYELYLEFNTLSCYSKWNLSLALYRNIFFTMCINIVTVSISTMLYYSYN